MVHLCARVLGSAIILILFFGCSDREKENPSGFSERDVAGVTWLFPEIKGYRSMEGMTMDEYQGIISNSYLIEMSPVYAYLSENGNCRYSLVFSVTTKYSAQEQSEYDFIRKSPSGVKELTLENKSGEQLKVLFVVYSVKSKGLSTRVVMLYLKGRILGFEMRPLGNCSRPDDYELLEFVKEFLELNV